jgi:hypothetical protein
MSVSCRRELLEVALANLCGDNYRMFYFILKISNVLSVQSIFEH